MEKAQQGRRAPRKAQHEGRLRKGFHGDAPAGVFRDFQKRL